MGDKFIHRIICAEVENLNWNPKNVNELFQARPECEGLQLKLLWKETKEWRQHWQLSKFVQALFFGLTASIFDLATDFHFARSVEED